MYARMNAAERDARITELKEDLQRIRNAMRAVITGGQAYSAEGRVMTRADLRELRALERDLAAELAQLKRNSGARVFGVLHR